MTSEIIKHRSMAEIAEGDPEVKQAIKYVKRYWKELNEKPFGEKLSLSEEAKKKLKEETQRILNTMFKHLEGVGVLLPKYRIVVVVKGPGTKVTLIRE